MRGYFRRTSYRLNEATYNALLQQVNTSGPSRFLMSTLTHELWLAGYTISVSWEDRNGPESHYALLVRNDMQ
jgi:hypothetical protein